MTRAYGTAKHFKSGQRRYERQVLWQEYDHLREFGKSHESAVRELGMEMMTFNATVQRAMARGEKPPKHWPDEPKDETRR